MLASLRLLDLPSHDDLEFLPDPGWDVVLTDWDGGGRAAGGLRSGLEDGVGIGLPNRRGDVIGVQLLLRQTGLLDSAAAAASGIWGRHDDFALRRFQKDNGLPIDGCVWPGDETIGLLRGALLPPARTPRPISSMAR